MSDVMLLGVLKMPYEMAMANDLSRLQFYQRVQQLVAQVEAQPPLPAAPAELLGNPEQLEQPEQEPVATVAEVHMSRYTIEWTNGPLPEGSKLWTTPPQPKPLTDDVLVPLQVLEAAENSLGSFCSDLGWSDKDMQNMDNLSAYIAQHKAVHGIKE